MGVLSDEGGCNPSAPQESGTSASKNPAVFGPYNSFTYVPQDSDYLVVGGAAAPAPPADYVDALSPTSGSASAEGAASLNFSEGSVPPGGTGEPRPASSGRGLWLTSPAVLDGKYVGLFFGADWCPYCKTFLSPLVKFYNFLRPTGLFEVVYVPCDRNLREYQSFVKTMPWYALPLRNYGDLIRKYNVKSLPSLVLVTPDDAVLSSNAVDLIKEKSAGEKFKQIFQRFNGPVSIGNRFRTLFG